MRCVIVPTPPDPKSARVRLRLADSIRTSRRRRKRWVCERQPACARAARSARNPSSRHRAPCLQCRLSRACSRRQQVVADRVARRDRRSAIMFAWPGAVSTRTGTPQPRSCVGKQAPSVVAEPGANGTMMRIGFSGYCRPLREYAKARENARLPRESFSRSNSRSDRARRGRTDPSTISRFLQRADARHEGRELHGFSGAMVQRTCGPGYTAVTLKR